MPENDKTKSNVLNNKEDFVESGADKKVGQMGEKSAAQKPSDDAAGKGKAG